MVYLTIIPGQSAPLVCQRVEVLTYQVPSQVSHGYMNPLRNGLKGHMCTRTPVGVQVSPTVIAFLLHSMTIVLVAHTTHSLLFVLYLN